MSDNKRIPAGDLSAYERWELPAIAGGKPKKSSFGNARPASAKLPTASEIEKIRAAAYEDGFSQGKAEGFASSKEQGLAQGLEEGRQQGLQQGLQQGQTQIQQQLSKLAGLLQQMADPVAMQQELVAQAMSNMATAIARSVIHRELHMDSASVVDLAMQALDSLPSECKQLTLSINPSDAPYFEDALKDKNLSITLLQKPEVHVGGCLVSTHTQLIDYTVEKRFQKSIQDMLMNLSQHDDSALAKESPQAIQELGEYPTELLDETLEAGPQQLAGDQPAEALASALPSESSSASQSVAEHQPSAPESDTSEDLERKSPNEDSGSEA